MSKNKKDVTKENNDKLTNFDDALIVAHMFGADRIIDKSDTSLEEYENEYNSYAAKMKKLGATVNLAIDYPQHRGGLIIHVKFDPPHPPFGSDHSWIESEASSLAAKATALGIKPTCTVNYFCELEDEEYHRRLRERLRKKEDC